MAVSDITLEYSGTEQRLIDWDFTDPILTLVSQARGTFTVRMPSSDLVSALDIPDGGPVIIRDTPAGNIIFQGKRRVRNSLAQPDASADVISFVDAWYDLERTPFQQLWKYYPIGGGAATTKRNSRLNLFFDPTTGALKTNGETIEEIITYAISKGIDLQLGDVAPAFNLPVYPTRSMMCSEAILLCLRPCPDAQTWIDYSTTPPTFNCQQRADLSPITLPFKGAIGSVKHKSSVIAARPDLQVSEVVIDYQKTNSITTGDGIELWNTYESDAFPPGSTGAIGSIVMPIDLRGAQLKSAIVTADTFDATDVLWWKEKKQDLHEDTDAPPGNARDVAIDAGSITIKDSSGADIDLGDFPNELIDGVVASWMRSGATQIQVIEATVTANLSWREVSPNSDNIETRKFGSHQVSVRVKLTNSAIGDIQYSTISAFDETAPSGLAASIYESLSDLAYEGTHELQESNINAIHGPWETLNLSGGATEWATMNAAIQSVRHYFFRGRTEIAFGPAKHIAPGDLAELLIWARYRQVLDDPNIQKTGLVAGASGQAELGKNTPKENTTEGLQVPKQTTESHDLGGVPAQTAVIVKDAENQKLQLHIVTTSTGVRDDSKGGLDIQLAHCLGSDGNYHILKIQEVDICDEDGTQKRTLSIIADPWVP